MKCRQPFVDHRGAYPCGQCMPCRFNRRRIWTHRLMLEASDHDENAFVTLTYAQSPRDLRPADLRDWLKRFRSRIEPVRIRYFACGEYGEKLDRPHYHVAIFGWGLRWDGLKHSPGCPCTLCNVVRETWRSGHVLLGTLTPQSAAYVCGYVTKRLTMTGDPRLGGRHPEFARMSLKPGIGADAMWSVASEMMRVDAEVPTSLNHGRKPLPLGRYLRNRLKLITGREGGATPQDLERLAAELQQVRAFAWANDRSVASVYEELNEGLENKLLQISKRTAL